MKIKHILICLLILVLVTPIFATQIFAKDSRCEQYEKRLNTYGERVDKYCSGKNYNQRRCASYKRLVTRYKNLINENCKPTCTDSDGGIDYYKKSEQVSVIDSTGKKSVYYEKCFETGLREYYCKEDNAIGFVAPFYKCPYGCQDGACIEDECSSHELSIGKVSNKDGKIAVSYKTVGAGDNVKVDLLIVSTYTTSATGGGGGGGSVEKPAEEETESIEPSAGGGGGIAINCPITGGSCSAGSGSNVVYCTVYTECNYPEYTPNTQYIIVKLRDQECPGVYDKEKIKLTPPIVPDFRIYLTGNDQAKLKFKDNDNNLATVPLFYSDGANLKLGDNNDDLITKEGITINKNDYIILTAEGKSSYALRYKGADKLAPGEEALVKFDELGTGKRIEAKYDRLTGANLKLDGDIFNVISASYDGYDDFDVKVDLNADGSISDNNVNIITYGKEILTIG